MRLCADGERGRFLSPPFSSPPPRPIPRLALTVREDSRYASWQLSFGPHGPGRPQPRSGRRLLFAGARRGSQERDDSRAGLPARRGLRQLGQRRQACQGPRQERLHQPARPFPARLRGLQAEAATRRPTNNFAEARQGPIADLTSTLARAWVHEAAGKTKEALAHARQSERCRLGPVLSALPPRAHRRPCRQARRRPPGLRPGLQEEPLDPAGSPMPMRVTR